MKSEYWVTLVWIVAYIIIVTCATLVPLVIIILFLISVYGCSIMKNIGMSIKSWLDKLKKSDSSVSEDYQTTLSPLLITEDKPQYKTVRNIANRLKEGDALNIALTGPYGSGKSSILRTLEKDFCDYKYLSISLATLKSSVDKEPSDEDIAVLNTRIEYSILQQLEYKEDQDNLCNSRFKRIYYKPWWNHLLKAIGVVLYVISIAVVFEPSFIWI